ncbi:hypothetical protein F3Y22_tig00006992pilonHSYRG00035 [Hibiscus syriacus]|uniref:DUF4283 domain-containing protein n=1 Tax=Hibiscus syriacus TaxID=106335 RepID=A0A6A3CAW0_HIBSY|nr:hypothetical protein F3Y22_tig00006992pilonHSYRG00035 [Hibiscus syriacus]
MEVFTLFVENIPKAMHWKGLWFTFARHGEVVKVFMARKLSKGGKRYGFTDCEDGEILRITSEKELATVCSVRNIESRLHEWGLGEIKVKRLGGKFFLLIIEDEDLGWSYLKEIFSSIDLWTEKLGALDRATWLEVSRVLLHCWNHTTLKRIAETWGSFEALGENADHSLDCKKVSVLITTKMKKISGPVEIAVEHMVYIARVEEIWVCFKLV